MYFNSIGPPFQGVNLKGRAATIPKQAFVTLTQLRLYQNVIQNYPGWRSILAAGQSLGGPGTLIDELQRFDGTSYMVVGGPSKIFTYEPGPKTLTDISGGLTFHAGYDNSWQSVFFNDFLYVTNLIDGVHKINGTTTTLVAAAPKARSLGVLESHLCAFNIDTEPQKFAWAAEATDNVWTPAANNDAGFFNILDEGSEGMAAVPLGNDLILYKGRAIIPLTFIGGNEVFGRRTTINGLGIIGDFALADLGDEHLIMGNDQFYSYSGGAECEPAFEEIRDAVYPSLHPFYRNRARGLYIEETREVIFVYADSSSTGDNNQAVVFNVEDRVAYGPFPILASMTGAVSRGVTLFVDDIEEIVASVSIIVDEYPSFSGGPMNLFASPTGDLLEIGPVQSNNGQAITRVLETGDHMIGQGATDEMGNPAAILPGSVLTVSELNLEIGDLGTVGTYQIFLGFRMELDDPIVFTPAYTVNSGAHSIKVPVRATGRWFRIKIIIPDSQMFATFGYQYGFEVTGRR